LEKKPSMRLSQGAVPWGVKVELETAGRFEWPAKLWVSLEVCAE